MKPVHTKYSTRDGGHYVPAMEHNGVLYISGQLSINSETGEIPAGGIKEEALQALANVELVLRERGLSKEAVVLCRLYIPDVKHWPEINSVYAHFFGDHKPARVVVPTNDLYAGCLVEVEAIAVTGEVE